MLKLLRGYESIFHQSSEVIYCANWLASKKRLCTCEVVYVLDLINESEFNFIFSNTSIKGFGNNTLSSLVSAADLYDTRGSSDTSSSTHFYFKQLLLK